MAEKKRKLTTTERIAWYRNHIKNPWKQEVARFEAQGLLHDEAVIATLDHHNVPKHALVKSVGTRLVVEPIVT